MTMAANGLAKLAEELGELQQVVGKMLAYGSGEHPDGQGPLLKRFEDESADVMAALSFTHEVFGADAKAVADRAELKFQRFRQWHQDPNC